MTQFGEFVSTSVEDGIGTLRIDRPKLNPLNAAIQEGIAAAAAELAADDAVAAVVLYGGEKAFAAGADIKEMLDMSYADMAKRAGRLSECFTAVARIPKPTVAAIEGYALGGGCELAMACDFRVAGQNAKLGQPEILLGVIPGAGGTQRLARLVGPARAKDIVFSGRFVDADEALAAAREGADALCVQGSQAGGHRSTHRVDAIPNDLSYVDLLREVRSVSALPLVAAGGIADGREAARALSLGAVAVQAGTAFLLADEAGTSAAHRAGVQDPALDRTVVTRAFSGRPARGLRNQFVRDHDARSVPVFPVVDQLTKPIRAAAAKVEDHQLVSLWAGTRWQGLRPAAAAEVVAALAPVDDRRR